jgi:hypothetical protein
VIIAKKSLQTLWRKSYKNKKIFVDQHTPALFQYPSLIIRKFRWVLAEQSAAANQAATNQITALALQRSHRRRMQPPRPETPLDELQRYLREPIIKKGLFNSNPILWWRDVGSKRFPKLSLLAADLLLIPASTSEIERQFNSTGSMVTARRNRLNRVTICQAQSLRSWRRKGIYRASDTWQHMLPLSESRR